MIVIEAKCFTCHSAGLITVYTDLGFEPCFPKRTGHTEKAWLSLARAINCSQVCFLPLPLRAYSRVFWVSDRWLGKFYSDYLICWKAEEGLD